MEDRLHELPRGWVWTRLGEISEKITDGTHFTPTYVDSGIPFISVKDIFDGKINFNNCKYISEKEHNSLIKRCHPEYQDVLITKSGTIGRTAVVKTTTPFSLFVSVALIKPFKKYISSDFISFSLINYINSIDIQQSVKGGVIKNLHVEDLKEITIPLPPLPEQHRIVDKIEELFTRLDAGVEALKKIKAQLKRYRQAVLKYAFEGKLTQQWRKANKDKLEPASVLLEKIKNVGANLRVRPFYQGRHAGLPLHRVRPDSGQKGQIGQTHRSAPTPAPTKELPELPDGWVWTTLGEITNYVENVNPKINPDKEFIYLDIASINNSQQKVTNPKTYFGKDAPSRARQLVKSGDILFSTVRTYLKNIAMVNKIYDGQIASTGFCVIRPFQQIQNRFIFWLVQTDDFLNPLNQLQRGTSYPAVRDSDVFQQIIPLPPLLEQQQIVEEIESRFSIADSIEKIIDQSLKQAERLRQSILKRAFEGKLVPQDPTDEPAEKLLERIKKEKESVDSLRQKSKRKK